MNVCDAAAGDTATVTDTLVMATANLAAIKEDPRVADKISDDWMDEAVIRVATRASLSRRTGIC